MKKSNLKSLINNIIRETIVNKLGEGQPIGGVKNDHDFDAGRTNVMKAVNVAENHGERPCDCGSGLPSEWEYDAQNIPLVRACDKCRKKKLARYRPEILRGYTQADVDEPIEPEDDRYEESIEDEKYEFKNGDKVRLTQQYGGGPNSEIFTLSQWDGKRGWIGDSQGSGWYVKSFQIIPARKQSRIGEKIGFDGKYVDDMESGVAVKKLHGLDEYGRPTDKKFYMVTKRKNMVGSKKGNNLKQLLEFAKARGYDEFAIYRDDQGFHSTAQLEYLICWYERDGGYYTNTANKQPDLFKKMIKIDGSGKFILGNANVKEQSASGAAGGYSTPFAFKKKEQEEEVNEMTGTGAVAGYQTPFAFSKNKQGSGRAIAAAKKYGTVVKSISEKK